MTAMILDATLDSLPSPDSTHDETMDGDATRPLHLTSGMVLVYVGLALYAFCYQMQTPVLPYLVDSLGADKQTLGQLTSFFGVIQTVSGFLTGFLLDAYGAKKILLLNFLMSAICYGMYFAASSVWWLYAAQLPTLLQHGMLASRTYLSVHARSVADRESLLAATTMAYGAGMIVGPVTGGLLADTLGVRAPAALAAIGSLLTCALLMTLEDEASPASVLPAGHEDVAPVLPPSTPPMGRQTSSGETLLSSSSSSSLKGLDSGRGADDIDADDDRVVGPVLSSVLTAARAICGSRVHRSIRNLLSVPEVRSLLAIKTGVVLAGSLCHGMLALVAKDRFGLGMKDVGMAMSFMGIIGTAAQIVLVPGVRALRAARAGFSPESRPAWALTDAQIILVGLAILTLGFTLFASAKTTGDLYTALALLSIAPMALSNIISGRFVSLSADKGFANAVDMTIGSVFRTILGPLLAGYIFAAVGFEPLGYLSALIIVAVAGGIMVGLTPLDTAAAPRSSD